MVTILYQPLDGSDTPTHPAKGEKEKCICNEIIIAKFTVLDAIFFYNYIFTGTFQACKQLTICYGR